MPTGFARPSRQPLGCSGCRRKSSVPAALRSMRTPSRAEATRTTATLSEKGPFVSANTPPWNHPARKRGHPPLPPYRAARLNPTCPRWRAGARAESRTVRQIAFRLRNGMRVADRTPANHPGQRSSPVGGKTFRWRIAATFAPRRAPAPGATGSSNSDLPAPAGTGNRGAKRKRAITDVGNPLAWTERRRARKASPAGAQAARLRSRADRQDVRRVPSSPATVQDPRHSVPNDASLLQAIGIGRTLCPCHRLAEECSMGRRRTWT